MKGRPAADRTGIQAHQAHNVTFFCASLDPDNFATSPTLLQGPASPVPEAIRSSLMLRNSALGVGDRRSDHQEFPEREGQVDGRFVALLQR